MARDHEMAPEPDGTRHVEQAAPERGTAPEPVRRSTMEPLPARAMDEPPAAPPAPGTRRNLVPDGRITHTGETVREWVRAALVQVGTGERWEYDASLVMLPSGRGTMSTAYAIVIFTPSPIMGDKPIGVVKVVSDYPSRDEVKSTVRAAVAEARRHRSAALNGGAARTGRPNGQ